MDRFTQLNILDIINEIGEMECEEILQTFYCPLNSDVENFIRNNAIEFAKQRIAISYLIVQDYNDSRCFLGYYTLANKFVNVSGHSLSKTMQKKMAKFSQYDSINDRYMVAMPLIAQLGKNFNPDIPISIKGTDLLEIALSRVFSIECMLGGKTVYIECGNQPKLFDFYSSAGFLLFDERKRQSTDAQDETLVQMMKYFKH